ncbi:T9SS type A sorting domain-containing protein [Fibrobacter sp.]|uniref:T9SS type A sorting domain-containing protein n=1 Tax=Fibrobacter sp. TaxID=35828 RepID=UPI00386FC8A3
MFTFGIDGVELYDGTQKIENPTPVLPVASFKNGVVFNPSTGVLFTPKAGFAEVYFYDMSGNLRVGISKNVNAGSTTMALERGLLAKGMYVVKVKLDGKAVFAKKFAEQ